jgi:SagB-type dehydrogenase family enzyme
MPPAVADHTRVSGDTEAALRFHAATKYRVLTLPSGEPDYVMGTPPAVEPPIWEEDWSIEPRPYKVYTSLPPLALPADLACTRLPALEAIARSGLGADTDARVPDRALLAQLARLSNGLLNRRHITPIRKRVVDFRTAGATGARYHLELYFVCGDLPDLPAGVYHYATQDHSLRQLRAGDVRGVLVAASGGEPNLAQAPVVLAMTSTFWRNAWRYRARAYRHTFWDAGTSLSNVLGVAASLQLPACLVLGFADNAVNALLGVDGEREATIVLCSLGRGAPAPAAPAHLHPVAHPTEPVSRREVTFAEIPRMHAASSLGSGEEAAAWRRAPLRRTLPPTQSRAIALEPLADDRLPEAPIEQVILARRSSRHYDTDRPLAFELFSTVLDRSSRGFAADCLALDSPPLHDNYLIVNAVAGLEPGIYLHRAQEGAIELLRSGDYRADAAHLAFDQSYAADAHVNSYYLTELGPVLATYGNRGYRLAQLEAALYAGRLHLAAQALGLGAVGSTSFDDEVIDLFSPRAAVASYMFITVFGARRRKALAQERLADAPGA